MVFSAKSWGCRKKTRQTIINTKANN